MRLGMLASKQLNGSLRAMSDFQEKRVKMLIDRDRELDELEAEINERVLMIITVRSPRADDLRRVLAATKAPRALSGSATTPAMSANAQGRSWRASRGSCRGTR